MGWAAFGPMAVASSRARVRVKGTGVPEIVSELCPSGGDCSGPITVDVIQRYNWFRNAPSGFAFLDPLMAR